MPEMTFTVRWPNGEVEQCYSPSLVMHDFLEADSTYSVQEFTHRATQALTEASDRVREKFGFACTSAAATTDKIHRAASRFPGDSAVVVLTMAPPVPGGSA